MRKMITMLAVMLLLSSLLTVGASALSLSEIKWGEIDWQDVIENKVVPAAVTGITLVGSVYIAFITTKNKILAASAKFEKAAENANETAKAANMSAEISVADRRANAEFQKELAEKMERLEKQQIEELARVRDQMNSMVGNMTAIKKAVCLGFANMGDMVENGTSHDVVKLLEADDGKENA